MDETAALAELAAVARDRAEAEKHLDHLEGRRDELVRALLQTRVPREDIAAAARVKPARLYQIRDGRR
jgi:hypothetical protein